MAGHRDLAQLSRVDACGILFRPRRNHRCTENGMRKVTPWANPCNSLVHGECVGPANFQAVHLAASHKRFQRTLNGRQGDAQQLGHRCSGDDHNPP